MTQLATSTLTHPPSGTWPTWLMDELMAGRVLQVMVDSDHVVLRTLNSVPPSTEASVAYARNVAPVTSGVPAGTTNRRNVCCAGLAFTSMDADDP